MKCYVIQESLIPIAAEEITSLNDPYVAILTPDEYQEMEDIFQMGIDMDLDLSHVHDTKAIVNYQSLTGTLNIPDHETFSSGKFKLAFALDDKGIVFIDADDYTEKMVEIIRETRHWRLPSLERFFYDFLEMTIRGDFSLIEQVESELAHIEEAIIKGDIEEFPAQLNDIRTDLLDLQMHYDHLIDLSQEFEENENGFFCDENLRYFRLFAERVKRLQDNVVGLRDYIVQLRNLISEQLSIKQNKIMTLLTVITTIFLPLTLIVGWFGMNFTNMPSINSPLGYPITIAASILIVIACLVFFKVKKWL